MSTVDGSFGLERGPPTTTKLTVKLLDASAIVVRKLEVFRFHPLVEGSHDGRRVVGVLQAQSVAQLVHSHQENVVPWRQKHRLFSLELKMDEREFFLSLSDSDVQKETSQSSKQLSSASTLPCFCSVYAAWGFSTLDLFLLASQLLLLPPSIKIPPSFSQSHQTEEGAIFNGASPCRSRFFTVQGSAASKWVSPPMPLPGK